jgi:hypothetical protein
MNKFSQFMKLNLRDVLKSLEVVLIGTVLPAVTLVVSNQRLPNMDDLKSVAWVAGAAWISYITKNWLTNSNDEFMQPEKPSEGEGNA